MDQERLVQNIKKYCDLKGVKPTVACKESGAGKSLISQIETRGIIPSIAKVQMLATYLGVTTSELLGEETKKPATGESDGPSENEALFRSLPPDLQTEALRYMRYLAAQANNSEGSED